MGPAEAASADGAAGGNGAPRADGTTDGDGATEGDGGSLTARCRRAEAALRRELDFPEATVEAEGPEGEIGLVRLPPEAWTELAEPERRRQAAAAVRAAGFRYAGLELGPAGGPAGRRA